MRAIVFELLKNHGVIPGSVVLSKAGHDIHRMYVVLSVEDKIALLADGRRKTRNRPKKKRVTHLKTIGMLTDWEHRLKQLESLQNEPVQNKLIQEWLLESMKELRVHSKREES